LPLLRQEFRGDIVPDAPYYNLPAIDRRDLRGISGGFGLPMGRTTFGGRTTVGASTGLSTVVQEIELRKAIADLRKTRGTGTAPLQTSIPTMPEVTFVDDLNPVKIPRNTRVMAVPQSAPPVRRVTSVPKPRPTVKPDLSRTDFDPWGESKRLSAPAINVIQNVPLPPKALPPPKLTKPETQPVDLGQIFTTLGTSYINAKYQQPVVQQPVFDPRSVLPEQWGNLLGYSDIPEGVPVMPGQSGGCCDAVVPPPPKGYHYNRKGCLTKNRRRKKRLATASDIKDLNALKSVLGPAALKTWIATH